MDRASAADRKQGGRGEEEREGESAVLLLLDAAAASGSRLTSFLRRRGANGRDAEERRPRSANIAREAADLASFGAVRRRAVGMSALASLALPRLLCELPRELVRYSVGRCDVRRDRFKASSSGPPPRPLASLDASTRSRASGRVHLAGQEALLRVPSQRSAEWAHETSWAGGATDSSPRRAAPRVPPRPRDRSRARSR